MAKRKGPEIHSAKAHRCVDKVKAKGHPESNAWAICTASIGKRGVYAKGHGGNANPKIGEAAVKKTIETEFDAVVEDLIKESDATFVEKGFSNDAPGSGGRFKACQASGKSAALCAYIGRRKYGGHQMAKWAAKGRKRG